MLTQKKNVSEWPQLKKKPLDFCLYFALKLYSEFAYYVFIDSGFKIVKSLRHIFRTIYLLCEF